MRTRGWIAAAVVSATSMTLALAWPMSRYPEPPAPAAEEEKLGLYEEARDQQWNSFFGDTVLGVDRPEVDVVEQLPTRERDLAYGRCLEDVGFRVTDYTNGIDYESSGEIDRDTLAIGQFACDSRYPYEGQFDYLMTVEQRSALYDYYTGYLPSCLAFIGIEVARKPPAREEFVATSVEWPVWTPYEALWAGGVTEEQYTLSERRCPSEPTWRLEMISPSAVDE